MKRLTSFITTVLFISSALLFIGCDPAAEDTAKVDKTPGTTVPTQKVKHVSLKRKQLSDLEAKNGKQTINWDSSTGRITRMRGKGIAVGSGTIESQGKKDVAVLAKSFMAEYSDLLEVDVKKLKVKRTHNGKKLQQAVYQQTHKGVPVANGFTSVVMKNGHVIMYTSSQKYVLDSVPVTPTITAEAAKKTVIDKLGLPENSEITNNGIVIYADNKESILTYELMTPVIVEDEEGLPVQYIVYVNATNGSIVSQFNDLETEEASGTITGMIYPVFTHEPQIEVPFKSEWITVNGTQGITDENGNYLIPNLTAPMTVDAELTGPWVNIDNVQLDDSHYSSTEQTWNWTDADTSYKDEESNCFYHVNLIHDYVKELGVDEMDFQMRVRVNTNASCNASAGSGGLNFYKADVDRRCESTGLDAGVIYHEYGHRINRTLVNMSWPYRCHTGNMNEGLSDYWGCTIMDDPCHSRYKGQDPNNPTGTCTGRQCKNTDRYPQNYNCEPHSAAEIVSGIFWDIREVLGADYTDRLVLDVLRLSPMSFGEMIENALISDDDNLDLSDGTPNIDLICKSSYENHGVFSAPCEGHLDSAVAEITLPGYKDSETSHFSKDEIIEVVGTAIGNNSEPFNSYRIEHSHFETPTVWTSNGVSSISSSKVVDGTLAFISTSSLNAGYSRLRLTVNYGANKEVSFPIVEIFIASDTMPGFPVGTSSAIVSTPSIHDLDGDGINELLIGTGTRFYVLQPYGTIHPNWNPSALTYRSDSKVAIFDVDGDSHPEIFLSAYNSVFAWNHDGTKLAGWPQNTTSRTEESSPTIGDLDNDGIFEILAVSRDGKLYIWHADGNLDRIINIPNMYTSTSSSPSIADVDGDGDLEIFCGNQRNAIYAWHHDGTLVDGWPFVISDTEITKITSAVTIANINGTGSPEIIFYSPFTQKLYVTDANANLLSGWPAVLSTSSFSSFPFGRERSNPSVGDIDADGDLEIFIGHYGRAVYGFDANGNLLPGWPQSTSSAVAATPVLVDIDNDNDLEIIVGDARGVLYGWHHDGTADAQFPIYAAGSLYGVSFIGDFNKNGKTDIVAGSRDANVYAWELTSDYGTTNSGWNQGHADQRNTGSFDSVISEPTNFSPVLAAIGDREAIEQEPIEFVLSYSDPDGDNVSCSVINLPPGATFDASTCAFSWTPTIGTAGVYSNVTFVVIDDGSPPQSDSEGITITVLPSSVGRIIEATYVDGLYCYSGGVGNNTYFSAVTDYGSNFLDTGGKLEFSFRAIPDNAIIIDAKLSMYLISSINDCTLGDPLFFYVGTGLTCEHVYKAGDDPGVPLGWLSSSNSDPQTCSLGALGWHTFNIKESIPLNSEKLFLEIRGNDLDGITSYRLWDKAAKPPTLTITYTLDDNPTGCTQNSECSDNNVCNGIETCVAGVCQPGTPLACDDGAFCNGVETCNPTSGCQPGAVVDCNDNVDCTVDNCSESLDRCVHVPTNSICSDGLFCDGVETCNITTGCQPGVAPTCNDNVDCTTDTCNELLNSCTFVPDNTLCSDNIFCNGEEICSTTTGCLSGTNVNCNDGVDCTTDSCDEASKSCKHAPSDGMCSDGLFCNGDEVCNADTGCQSGTSPDCNDGVDCTVDSCDDLANNCMNDPDSSLCSDGSFCNGDEICDTSLDCQPGISVNCDDGVACTIDRCDETTDQCVYECVSDPLSQEIEAKLQEIERLTQEIRQLIGG